MSKTCFKFFVLSFVSGLALLFAMDCAAPPPKVTTRPEEEIKTVAPAVPDFMMKSYHLSMSEEMQRSFEIADEIIMGVYTGGLEDKNGLTLYFDGFQRFDKTTLAWGPVENVVLPILAQDVKPEIITGKEFQSLSEFDKVGICWDEYEQTRSVYLVEGMPSIVFIKHNFDGETNGLSRNLIDTYPVTQDCKAKAVFDWMVRNLFVDAFPGGCGKNEQVFLGSVEEVV